ncbi:MAG: group II intron reverse transcriptase/maturase [bacterium]
MDGGRQKIQYDLAFASRERGEAPASYAGGTEPDRAERSVESRVTTERIMEEVCERENLMRALKRVISNKGSPGIDEMSVEELRGYLRKHWPDMRDKLLGGTYKPQPVKRVEIPKEGGGVRKLGIPTVVDRFIQQAMLQVLQWQWDPTFSDHSFGFRPGRSAHDAVARAQEYVIAGYGSVVDLDLEKFFDRVNHDKLMGQIAQRIGDKRCLKLIRAFLNAGVMEDGLVSPTEEGTPQGGPLSPLLSNIVLDDLDRELERRGHRFVRYADDCNIYVRSERAGHRVMEGVSRFITKKLKLKVNGEKSAVGKASNRQFLGFGFTGGKTPKRRISSKAVKRFKERVRKLTRRTRGGEMKRMVSDLSVYLRGWIGYFGFCETPSVLRDLDSWVRRRMRCVVWKRWKRGRTRFAELRKRDVGKELAAKMAGSAHGPWRLSRSQAMSIALPNVFFASLGLRSLAVAFTP